MEFKDTNPLPENLEYYVIDNDPEFETKHFEDKSCGISNAESTIQTKDIILLEKSIGTNISYIDVGLSPSIEVSQSSISSSSQIPKLETYSKLAGTDYQDKATLYTKETSSKASEIQNEDFSTDFSLDALRSLIQSEMQPIQKTCHKATCSDCSIYPIYGFLYKCTTCPGFTLCSACENTSSHPHSLLKLKRSEGLSAQQKTLRKIISLGFHDISSISKALLNNNFDYTSTIRELLGIYS